MRDSLKLHVGDRLEFLVDPDGSVRIRAGHAPGDRPEGAPGPRPARALSLEEIDAVIAERSARKKRP